MMEMGFPGLKGRGSADSKVTRYRADVDGLRGIAVLSVVLYHLFPSALPGGYLGVDIFFVISGYLITQVIWREMQLGRFSIATFYDRRIRRILPALLVVLFVTSAACYLLLLPGALVGFGASLAATLFFVANVYFLRDVSDYFARAADYKPLLHMWTLGVEEQFYILFPLLLVLLVRYWRRGTFAVVILLAAASLGLDMLAHKTGFTNLAFYLLPTRAWELGLGAILALAPQQATQRLAGFRLFAIMGALLLALGVLRPVSFFDVVPTPLPVTVGAFMLIMAGQQGIGSINRALSLRPIVFVGLISYSLYLWHWPVIVLSKYYLVRDMRPIEAAAALGAMFFLSVASWQFVERPFRSKKVPMLKVRYIAVAGVLVLSGLAAMFVGTKGLPGRFGEETLAVAEAIDANYRCPLSSYIRFGRATSACEMQLPSGDPADADVVLYGNSHAKMYAPVWESILKERGESGLIVWMNGCLPTVSANINQECSEAAREAVDAVIGLSRARIVIIGLTWWHDADGLVGPTGVVVDNSGNRALLAALDDLILRLQSAGKKLVLIGPIAEPGYDVASVISRQLGFGHRVHGPTYLSREDFSRRFAPVIEHFAKRGDIGFARPDLVQCSEDNCYFILDGRILFADSYHIVASETLRFRKLFALTLPPVADGSR